MHSSEEDMKLKRCMKTKCDVACWQGKDVNRIIGVCYLIVDMIVCCAFSSVCGFEVCTDRRKTGDKSVRNKAMQAA